MEANENYSDSAMIAIRIPRKIGSRLHVAGGEKIDDMHITLIYIGKIGKDLKKDRIPTLLQKVEAFAKVQQPMKGDVAGITRFPATSHSEGRDVIVADISVKGLAEFREALVKVVEPICTVHNDFAYHPHCTIKYVEKKEDSPVRRLGRIPLKIDSVSVYIGTEIRTFKLG